MCKKTFSITYISLQSALRVCAHCVLRVPVVMLVVLCCMCASGVVWHVCGYHTVKLMTFHQMINTE
jgi:hypothetical protein